MKGRRSIVAKLLLVTLLGALLFVLHGLESTFANGRKSANKGAENKITLCHEPGTSTEKTISVSANDLGGHLAHGDLEGPCVLIDAHSQYGPFEMDPNQTKVIELVQQGGISQIILGHRGGRSAGELLSLAKLNPDRIIPSINADFDVTQIDPASIRLEGVSPVRSAVKDVATPFEPIVGKVSKFDCTREGPDGFDDLNLKFRNKDVVAALGDVSHRDVLVLELTANLNDGTPIVGEDVVVIVKKGE